MSGLNALVVCPEGRGEAALARLIADATPCALVSARSVSEGRRAAADGNFALIVINAPLRDETGLEWAMELTRSCAAAVILIVKAELLGMVYEPAAETGVLVVQKPLSPQIFSNALMLAIATHNRLIAMSRENEKLAKRLAELRVIDRAKCLLIEHMRISEEEAHRAIEKRAMDERLPRLAVARQILDRYEI